MILPIKKAHIWYPFTLKTKKYERSKNYLRGSSIQDQAGLCGFKGLAVALNQRILIFHHRSSFCFTLFKTVLKVSTKWATVTRLEYIWSSFIREKKVRLFFHRSSSLLKGKKRFKWIQISNFKPQRSCKPICNWRQDFLWIDLDTSGPFVTHGKITCWTLFK